MAIIENLYVFSIAVLLLISIFHARQLKKIKRERTLTKTELLLYYITRTAIFVWLVSFLIIQLGT
ncbi:hypothetical protein [Lysinibacillus antri]|uniref:Uncharacterized protein n=1 Tax=Lysinibacillus antri TaxID=2498145 RepID=A0A432LAY4_9BACI|nr:hypothetical protein [Lysinibacillus antri]RUL51335.1 hypothetical protein EK386_12400 [Lysinibacillus antri]